MRSYFSGDLHFEVAALFAASSDSKARAKPEFELSIYSKEEIAWQWTASLPSVAAYIRSFTHDFHDSQDILQEVSMVVVRKYAEYDRNKPFVAWAIGIARNELLAYRRRKSVYGQVFDDESFEKIGKAFAAAEEDLDPVLEALQNCMKQVPGKSRGLLQLRYIDDLRYEDIARTLNVSVGSIKVGMHRLRAALRECVERQMNRARSVP
jgi:RNA polymerase sigma-70 factor (ECF subfamily)